MAPARAQFASREKNGAFRQRGSARAAWMTTMTATRRRRDREQREEQEEEKERRREAPDLLSRDALRLALFRAFRERGVLDALKAQLRGTLVAELQRRAPSASLASSSSLASASSSPATGGGGAVLAAAADALVARHLRARRYDYSLSVFLPESGLGAARALSERELLRLLSVGPASPGYAELVRGTNINNIK
ncbi:oral-facial-digital syndrome 1 protein [Ochotona curzoniae]|uniref:oral-facial-digital syndrome 1 protein n=1 Tax=Ochotona curzoniae TaxID=130825 RepID=UPI001B3537B3|nr:oral-facial-digital syndrome 1 protein [Ochotona curzoniae]